MSAASILSTEPVRPLKRLEYDRLVGLGMFENERVELIRGIIVAMSPQKPPHAESVSNTEERLKKSLGERARVRVQCSYAATDDSEPEPDVAVVERLKYAGGHPTAAFLIVEVAYKSRHRDLRIKPGIYAASHVQEYWVVDIHRRQVVVHRFPDGTGWGLIQRFAETETLSLVAFPDVSIKVADLLP